MKMSENNNEFLILIAETLIKKFGKDKIVKLLTDELCIDVNQEKLKKNRKAYVRDLKKLPTPFTDHDGHELDADLILIALEEAANEMNYSNWHGDKLDRASEVVFRYCEEHNIPITFKIRE